MAAQATNHRTGHAEIISAFCLALLAKVGAKGIHCLVVIIWIFLTVQAFLEPDVCQSSSKQNVCPKPAPPLPGHQNQRLEFLFPISLSLPKAGQSSPKRSIVQLGRRHASAKKNTPRLIFRHGERLSVRIPCDRSDVWLV